MKSIQPLICIGLLITTLHAGDAVSSLNGKLGFNYGDYDSDEGRSVNGSIALPVTTHFGAQMDGLYTHVADQDFYGAGGHFFWRDSDKAMIGVGAASVYSKNVYTYEAGLEAEYYFKWFTPGFYTGYSGIKYRNSSSFIDTDRVEPFGTVYLGIYPLPDLVIRPSFTRKLGNNLVGVEAEYEMPRVNLSVTAESTWGEHDFRQTQFGLRYYFGSKKSLKRRHREDDPVNLVAGSFTSIGTYGAEHIANIKKFIRDNPGLFTSAPPDTGTTTGTTPSTGSDTSTPGSSTVVTAPTQPDSSASGSSTTVYVTPPTTSFGGSTQISGGIYTLVTAPYVTSRGSFTNEQIQQAIAQGGTLTLSNGSTLQLSPSYIESVLY
jgi:hypothetical protein